MAQPRRPKGDPEPLPYLLGEADQQGGALDLELEALLLTAAMREWGMAPNCLPLGKLLNMGWTPAQVPAHHASNGCNLNPGDLLGTGTISAPTPGQARRKADRLVTNPTSERGHSHTA